MALEAAYQLVVRNVRLLSAENRQWLLYELECAGAVLHRNLVVCHECAAVIESKSRHDFQQCHCENRAFVDGGREPGFSRCGAMRGVTHFQRIEDAVLFAKRKRAEKADRQRAQSADARAPAPAPAPPPQVNL